VSGEKTEKPTAKRRKESRKEGQVARTQELGGWASVLVFGMAMPVLLKHEFHSVWALFQQSLTLTQHPTTAAALTFLGQAAKHVFIVLLAMGASVMVIGVASALLQGGFVLATKSVKPSAAKLNPIKGAKRIFGPQAAWEGVKMLLKSSLVGLLVYGAIRGLMPLVGGMVPVQATIQQLSHSALGLMRNIALAGLALAAADYAMQRRRVGKQTRMSKEEVKQEHKQQDMSPQLKGRMRGKAREMARARMLGNVKKADVIVTNPTHFAVALAYRAGQNAPRVLAKGADLLAFRIRELGREHDIAIVENPPLARQLYADVEVGQEVPVQMFALVAEVLAYVWRTNRARKYAWT